MWVLGHGALQKRKNMETNSQHDFICARGDAEWQPLKKQTEFYFFCMNIYVHL